MLLLVLKPDRTLFELQKHFSLTQQKSTDLHACRRPINPKHRLLFSLCSGFCLLRRKGVVWSDKQRIWWCKSDLTGGIPVPPFFQPHGSLTRGTKTCCLLHPRGNNDLHAFTGHTGLHGIFCLLPREVMAEQDAPTGRYPCSAASFPSRFCIYCACDSSCRQYAVCANWDKRTRYTLTFIACIAGKLSVYPVFHNRIQV